jgi:hypothetical protein
MTRWHGRKVHGIIGMSSKFNASSIAWTDDPLARAQGAWDNWDELEIQRELDWSKGR